MKKQDRVSIAIWFWKVREKGKVIHLHKITDCQFVHQSFIFDVVIVIVKYVHAEFLYIYVARKIITYFLREYILFLDSFTIWWTKSSSRHIFRLRRIILWWEEWTVKATDLIWWSFPQRRWWWWQICVQNSACVWTNWWRQNHNATFFTETTSKKKKKN